jgi:hypothetical protein
MLYANDQVLLAELEVTEGTDPTPTTAANAIKTGKVMPGYSFQEIQRLAVTKGINATRKLIGLEMLDMEIPVELKGAGAATTAAEWSVLMRACGYKETAVAANAVVAPERGYANTGTPSTLTVTSAGAYTPSTPKRYIVTVTTPGASGVAKVSVVCPEDPTENSADNTVTTATPIDLGTGGATITFTFASGNLASGDKWIVFCQVPGKRYQPVATTDTQETCTIYLYLGGLLWKAHACRGDFKANLEAGQLASLTFSMKGKFGGVTDVAVPTDGVYQDSVTPVIVENAGSCFDSTSTLVIRNLSFETGNNLTTRANINAEDGIQGYRFGIRDPRFSANIEAELEATFAFIAKLRARTEMLLNAKVGSVSGNIVDFYARRACFDQPGVTEETDLLMYNLTGQCLSAYEGDKMIEVFTR